MDPLENRIRAGWKQNPDAVREDILRVAAKVFARNGFSGARIEEITAQTKTSKRMIYYYFGDKAGLYAAVIEAAYQRIRQGEAELNLVGLAPKRALAALVAFTFDHHRQNADFVRLVMSENMHGATVLNAGDTFRGLNAPAIRTLADLVERGVRLGDFRADLDPMVLHWQISALCFFNVSNQPSFEALYGDTLFDPAGQARLKEEVIRCILTYASA